MSDPKLDHVIDAVRALAGDTSVPESVTRVRITSIKDTCRALLDRLDEEDGIEDEGILGDA